MHLFKKTQNNLPRRRQASYNQAKKERAYLQDQQVSFKRNRTFTGSASSNIKSTNEQSAQMKSPRVQAHDLVRRQRHLGSILLAVIVVVLSLWGLIYQFSAGVVLVASSRQLDDSYGKSVQEYFSQYPLERLRFLLDLNKLAAYVHQQNPEVKMIKSVSFKEYGVTQVEIIMREPIAGWNIAGVQHFVDDEGVAFTRNYFQLPSVQITDKSGVQVETGKAVASNRFLGFVGRAVGAAKLRDLTVTEIIIPQATTRQIELRVQGIDYPIKLSTDRGAGVQIEDMARAINWFTAKDQTPQYIDVRVPNKAYYR